MREFLKKHRNFVKVVSVVVVSALLLGIFPADVFSGLVTNTQAAYVPDYDPALGSYTVEGSTLIAEPADNCGFRGWYDKSGKEVSASKTLIMPTGDSKDDYTPVFYDFNLIENGGFEGSTPGVDLKKDVYDDNIWYGYTSGENDWTKAVVSNDKANSGNNSARFYSRNNTIYRNITGLDVNTQYKLSFYYNIANSVTDSDGNTSNPYLKYAVILPKDTELNSANNHQNQNFAVEFFANATNGGCAEGEWRQVTLTFFTRDTTDFILALTYIANADTYLYIDDLSLIKDELAAPTYANDDFSTQSVANWSVPSKNFAISYKNGRLETQAPTDNYGVLVSAPFWVNKGREYKVSFKLDLSDVDNYMRKIEKGTFATDEEGNPVYMLDSSGDKKPNFFCFYVGKAAGDSLNVNSKILVKNGETTNQDLERTTTKYESWPAYYGGSTVTAAKPEYVKNLTCTMTFTAPESEVLYFSTKLFGYGTYAIDDFKVEETSDSDIAVEEAIKHSLKTVGTAIRTTGNQGIRHKTEVDKRLLCDEGYFGIRVKEYGTVAMRNDILGGQELVLDGIYNYNGKDYKAVKGEAYSFADEKDFRFDETKNGIQFTGVLINISETIWNKDFTMRGYMKYDDANGTEKVIYTDPIDSSIYLVSKFAYSAKTPTGEFAESDEIREYLYTSILSKYKDKNITINDDETPIYTNFQGISSTVYHCNSVVSDGVHNRTYTEENLEIEMDRLVDSGIDNVRTLFRSRWAWDNTKGGWNWESNDMKAIYEWAKMLQERRITITLNAGWQLQDIMCYADYHYFDQDEDGITPDTNEKEATQISEVEYLKKVTLPDLYNETDGTINTADGVTKEEYYTIASARYGEWIKQALNAFKENGVYNIKYIMPFTETGKYASGENGEYPSGRNDDGTEKNPEYCYWEWVEMTKGLHTALEKAEIRDDYKIIGPSQSINVDQERTISLMEYYTNAVKDTEFEGMVDILSSHHYPKPDTKAEYEKSIYNPYSCYSWANKNFDYFETLRNSSEKNADGSNKEFWADEYFTNVEGVNRIDDVAFEMTQFAACLTKGINTGINRFLSWQIFDTLWDKLTNTGDSWIGGVHACGTAPALIDTSNCTKENCPCHDYDDYVSKTPRKLYYGLNLLGKHLQNKNASVVYSNVEDKNYDSDGGLYVSSIINDENRLVVLVANTTNRPTNFDLNIQSGEETKFTRYTYNPEAITPTEEAKSIPSDGYITATEGTFYDTLAPGSFAIYISEIRDQGEDVIIDMGGLSLPN